MWGKGATTIVGYQNIETVRSLDCRILFFEIVKNDKNISLTKRIHINIHERRILWKMDMSFWLTVEDVFRAKEREEITLNLGSVNT